MAGSSALVGLAAGGILLLVSTPIWSPVGIGLSKIVVAVWCWAEVFRWHPVQDGPAARRIDTPARAAMDDKRDAGRADKPPLMALAGKGSRL